MEYSILGSSGLSVSRVCLGSMTWGVQNNQQDADAQIEYALAQGINFIDTAEMYAVPPKPETYGTTETIIGNWLAANPSRRQEIVLATKITGPGLPWIRGGGAITGEAVLAAVDASLERLQSDYIDLYQLHWPNRLSPHFGKHHPNQVRFSEFDTQQQSAGMLEILQALDQCVKAGKIRHIGLSDETCWGISEYIRLSEQHNLPRITSIQNEFNLIHAKDWPYLIETCVRSNVAYLPWSPLAAGVLTGKYIDGARPDGSRWTITQRNALFRDTEAVNEAVKCYSALARAHDLSAAELALAWIDQVDGVTSTIIGATSMQQLQEDIGAFSKSLSSELLVEVEKVFKRYALPF